MLKLDIDWEMIPEICCVLIDISVTVKIRS